MLAERAAPRGRRWRPIMLSTSSNSPKKPWSNGSSGSSGISSKVEDAPSSSLASLVCAQHDDGHLNVTSILYDGTVVMVTASCTGAEDDECGRKVGRLVMLARWHQDKYSKHRHVPAQFCGFPVHGQSILSGRLSKHGSHSQTAASDQDMDKLQHLIPAEMVDYDTFTEDLTHHIVCLKPDTGCN